MASLFTKIINGDIPCLKIFEDELTYAFLDIRPIQIGHSLIVPKNEVDYFLDCDSEAYLSIFENAKNISKAIQKATQCKRIGLVVAGYEVPHFHLHMIPTWGLQDFDFKKGRERDSGELKKMQTEIVKYI